MSTHSIQSTGSFALLLFALSITLTSPKVIAILNNLMSEVKTKKKSIIARKSVDVPKAENITGKVAPPSPEVQKGRVLPGVCVSEIQLLDIPTLRNKFPSADSHNDMGPGYNQIIGGEDFIIHDIVRKSSSKGAAEAFVRAGPRSFTHFNPSTVRAGSFFLLSLFRL